jgi:DNA-binding LacI/PurR family transcriptional regulator
VKTGKVTMSDVARLAGVSPMTVSNVINNRVRVSDTNRERVLEAIQKSGYQLNLSARNLRSGRSGVIGLAVPQVANSYYGMLAALLIDQAEHQGYHIAIERTGAVAEGAATAIERSRRFQLDGLILAAVDMDPLTTPILSQSYPIVMLGEQDAGGRFDHIMMPNEAGAAAATTHLIEQGCDRIAVVTGAHLDRLTMVTRRFNGYRSALEEHGLRPEPELRFVLESLSWEGARETGRRIADAEAGIDGVVALNDTTAMGVMRGLRDRGVAVPDDIRVIGFDNVSESGNFIPSLSTVAPDHQWVAAKAFELMLSRIDDPAGPPRQYTAPFELVRRESTS